jgi:hypothetical protein
MNQSSGLMILERKMLYKSLFIVHLFLFLGLTGCAGSVGAPIDSQPGTPKLTTEFVMKKELQFRSVENGFLLDYPADWVVEGEGLIWVTPSETDFPQDHSSVLTEATFTLFTKSPYAGYTSSRRRIPQPASEVAQDIANTMKESPVIMPVESVDINGRDGAIYLLAPDTRYHYSIVLRVADDKVAVLDALGPSSRSEEMQNILNAIALNIRPLSE